jgi:hypothetical protein
MRRPAPGLNRRSALCGNARAASSLVQDLSLLGHVYGHADLVLRIDEQALERAGSVRSTRVHSSLDHLGDALRVELIEPTQGIPVMSPTDYRRLDGYLIHVEHEENGVTSSGPGLGRSARRRATTLETLTPGRRVIERDGRVVLDERSTLLPDIVPVVHVQNLSQPFRYAGLSEVEPLIPLQDELNTRLSDRACRVDDAVVQHVPGQGHRRLRADARGAGPGLVDGQPGRRGHGVRWRRVEPVGGRAHRADPRGDGQGLGRPAARRAGVVRARIGNLSSANALRITLMSLLAKTARKRQAYGRAMTEMNALILRALDAAGVLRTTDADRATSIEWPDPLGAIAEAEQNAHPPAAP